MNTVLVVAAFILATLSCVGQVSVSSIRDSFFAATTEEDLEKILSLKCSCKQSDSADVFKAYQAVARTRMAEHVFWPHTKISHFNVGKDSLEACIARTRNLETVYLRLVVQLNAPGILGYNDELVEDRAYVEKALCTSALPAAIIRQMRESIEQ